MKSKIKYFTLTILFALFVTTMNGCGIINRIRAIQIKKQNYAAEIEQLNKGFRAFESKEYQKALELFRSSQHASNEEIARNALYAVACTQLIIAETPEELRTALNEWEVWYELQKEKLSGEDPRMLHNVLTRTVVLKGIVDYHFDKIDMDQDQNAEPPEKSADSEARLKAYEKQIQRLKKKLKDIEKENLALRESAVKYSFFPFYIERLENEIKILKNKINSLEAIDQKIQEKKKEVISP